MGAFDRHPESVIYSQSSLVSAQFGDAGWEPISVRTAVGKCPLPPRQPCEPTCLFAAKPVHDSLLEDAERTRNPSGDKMRLSLCTHLGCCLVKSPACQLSSSSPLLFALGELARRLAALDWLLAMLFLISPYNQYQWYHEPGVDPTALHTPHLPRFSTHAPAGEVKSENAKARHAPLWVAHDDQEQGEACKSCRWRDILVSDWAGSLCWEMELRPGRS